MIGVLCAVNKITEPSWFARSRYAKWPNSADQLRSFSSVYTATLMVATIYR